MPRSLPARSSTPLLLALALIAPGISAAQAQPIRGGLGGPASGAGVMPGAGFGQAGPGLVNPVGPGGVAPAAGGAGGPASGAGVMPGAGFGQAGPGLVNPAGARPAAGGAGGPASGAGLQPGAGIGRPGLGR